MDIARPVTPRVCLSTGTFGAFNSDAWGFLPGASIDPWIWDQVHKPPAWLVSFLFSFNGLYLAVGLLVSQGLAAARKVGTRKQDHRNTEER